MFQKIILVKVGLNCRAISRILSPPIKGLTIHETLYGIPLELTKSNTSILEHWKLLNRKHDGSLKIPREVPQSKVWYFNACLFEIAPREVPQSIKGFTVYESLCGIHLEFPQLASSIIAYWKKCITRSTMVHQGLHGPWNPQ